jgi:hypothetical protein
MPLILTRNAEALQTDYYVMSGGLRVGSSISANSQKDRKCIGFGPPPACRSLRSCQWRLVVARRSSQRQLSIASSHATDKPTDTKRYECRSVWTFLDGMADIILSIPGSLADQLGGI